MTSVKTQDFYFIVPDYTACAHIEKVNGVFRIKADTIRNKTLCAVGNSHESAESALEELIKLILKNYGRVSKIVCSEAFVSIDRLGELVNKMNLSCELELN